MSLERMGLRAMVLGGLATLILILGAQSAQAEASTHCVKATKETKIVNGKPKKLYTGGYTNSACSAPSATHEGKYEKLAAFSESEEQQLKALLKYVKVQASGVAGKPTVQFSGANVQVVNGATKTASTNGTGNLVLGYDESPGTQTGSHDLILGEEQTFTSYGGIVGGRKNTISGPFASVSGGFENAALGDRASVSGGSGNKATFTDTSVSGGEKNTASGFVAWVSGGEKNQAFFPRASVSGGSGNKAIGESTSVSGGENNTAGGFAASVSGGEKNEAGFPRASVSGGSGNKAIGESASVSGGEKNTAGGFAASVSGGENNTASGFKAWIGGGQENTAEAKSSSIFGGKKLKASEEFGVALPNVNYETLTLLNGWKGPASGSGTPAVGVDLQGIVHFRGGMEQSGAFKSEAFVLPAQFRPAHTVYQAVDMSTSTTGRILIQPGGSVFVEDTAGGKNAQGFTSLDDVTYALG